MKSLNQRITIWVEHRQRVQIDKAVSEGRGKNVSDLMRVALTELLKTE